MEKLGAIAFSSDIFEKANIGLWAFELDEGCEPRMYADDTMLRLIGLSHQISPEETYHAWYDHIDPDHLDEVTEAVEKMTAGVHAEVQYPWHHPDGAVWTVRCGGVRNFAYTKGIRIEGTHQNVTDITHFEKETIEKLGTVIEALGEDFSFIAHIDPKTMEETIYRADPEINVHMPGWDQAGTYDERVSVVARALVHPDDRESFLKKSALPYVTEKLQRAPVNYFNFRIVIEGNIEYHQAKYVLVDIGGEKSIVMGYRSVDTETRQQLMIQAELSEARERAEAASRAKSAFLFNMSHDIRTPMNAIIGFTEMAQKYKDDPEKVESCMEKVSSSSKHLLSLINDVLDMARIESGKLQIEDQIINIREASKPAMAIAYENAKARDITLTLHSGPVGDEYIYGDPLKISQIALNIMSNAVKYTNPGGRVDVRVDAVPCDDPERLVCDLIVEDTGIGMSEEFLAKVFEPFERSANSTKTGIQGTGLGMAITKALVEQMGGKIWIESHQGVGTKVTVRFDFRRAGRDEIRKESGNGEIPAIDLTGKKVLLVEDNELNREIAEDILLDEGLIVDTAEDGDIAVEKMQEASEGQYDLVLMDIQMPRMNGYESAKAIRKLPGDYAARIPIIAMTANAFDEDKKNAFAAGMNGHIAKPIDIAKLLRTLSEVLGK